MELLEVLKKLANHYQYGIDNLPKDDAERKWFLDANCIDLGICSCAEMSFDFDVKIEIFQDYDFKNGGYLFEIPLSETYETAKDLLQKRLNVLNELITKHEK